MRFLGLTFGWTDLAMAVAKHAFRVVVKHQAAAITAGKAARDDAAAKVANPQNNPTYQFQQWKAMEAHAFMVDQANGGLSFAEQAPNRTGQAPPRPADGSSLVERQAPEDFDIPVEETNAHATLGSKAAVDFGFKDEVVADEDHKGLTAHTLQQCSYRTVFRKAEAAKFASKLEKAKTYIGMAGAAGQFVCSVAPDYGVLKAVTAALDWKPGTACTKLTQMIQETAEGASGTVGQQYAQMVAKANAMDCQMPGMVGKKMFCDLHCIEDAVPGSSKSTMERNGFDCFYLSLLQSNDRSLLARSFHKNENIRFQNTAPKKH